MKPDPAAPTIIAWGARSIHTAHHHINHLPFQTLHIRGHTEHELCRDLPTHLEALRSDTPVCIVVDDLTPSTQSVRTVIDACLNDGANHCGWSNADFTSGLTNIQKDPILKDTPLGAEDYDLLTVDNIAARSKPFAIGFNGFTLLTMQSHTWQEHIEHCCPPPGYASDWRTCYRLQQAGQTITCHPAAFVAHLKMDYTRIDFDTAWKKLDLINKTVRWET